MSQQTGRAVGGANAFLGTPYMWGPSCPMGGDQVAHHRSPLTCQGQGNSRITERKKGGHYKRHRMVNSLFLRNGERQRAKSFCL